MTAKEAAKSTTKKTARSAKRSTSKQSTSKSVKKSVEPRGLTVNRFAGIALGGGKTDRTAVAVIEYYPDSRRVFLRAIRDKVKGHDGDSGDQALIDLLTIEEPGLESIAFDAPLQLPKCIRCELVCPGFESCRLPEIRWLWNEHEARASSKRPNKVFTPYTERCAEVYIANHLSRTLEEPFHPPHALGANAAPLAARAHYLARRLTGLKQLDLQSMKRATSKRKGGRSVPRLVEVYPKLSLWQIGRDLKMPKSYLRFHRHAIDSDEARHYVIKTLMEREIAFVYQQDLRTLIDSPQSFDAFISALTAYLEFRGQTVARPQGFPSDEIWITYPKNDIHWT